MHKRTKSKHKMEEEKRILSTRPSSHIAYNVDDDKTYTSNQRTQRKRKVEEDKRFYLFKYLII